MKVAFVIACLLCLAHVNSQSYGGVDVYQANLAPNSPTDIQGVSGFDIVRISGNNLQFDTTLFAAQQITFLDLHLSPTRGAVDRGPLVVRLADFSASPVSAGANGQLQRSGTIGNSNLLANPALGQARGNLSSLGVFDNPLQTISDVNRLLKAGLIYGDVHAVNRPPPQRVVSGLFFSAGSGKRRMLWT